MNELCQLTSAPFLHLVEGEWEGGMGVERKKSNSGRREADVNSTFYTEGSRRNDTVQRWSCWLVMNLLSIVNFR